MKNDKRRTKKKMEVNTMKKATFFIFMAMVLLYGSFSGSVKAEKGPVQVAIESLEVGRPVNYGNLTVVPIYAREIRDKTEYVTLEDALKNKWIEIKEMEGGRVPLVRITNRSKHIIYIMGGEILTGCKQDRILSGDVLLGPGTKNLLAQVYCVEHGRWSYTSTSFYSKKNIGTYKLRARAQKRSPAAQEKIWDQIAKQNEEMGIASATNAYQDAYDKEENKGKIAGIEREMKKLPRLYEDTVGIVVGLGREVISVDIFANPYLFKKQWPKILKSSALSSIHYKKAGTITQQRAARFLKSLMDRKFNRKPAMDLGYELAVNDSMVNANTLVYESVVIHLAGFPQEEERIAIKRRRVPEQQMQNIRRQLQ